ncbi:uncharacterized protein N7511_007625 [Penicillium nucicola]|uniref:uncharacterized protein n=1 Tax=Penicillium nucicola TaxID=1850975 RepID=UPI002544E299|nr:uncharacterized protein N7511_007625 [Penicillium nucicola]KAJ5753472.1 hypothetical protein N7511_007625 [Penicillium nucicola]
MSYLRQQGLVGDVWLLADQKGNKLFPDASLGLGLPTSFYFWQRGGKQNHKTNVVREEQRESVRGANQEYTNGAEGNEGKPGLKGNNPLSFDDDKPRGMGSPGGPKTMSFKQEGLSNADAMHPYVNDPGKSKKGEGETETVKVKGTVRTDRPQV